MIPTIVISVAGVVVGVVVLFFIIWLAAAWFEKKPINPFEPTTTPVETMLHKYLRTKIHEAKELELEEFGWYRSIGGYTFRVIITLWRSTDNLILVAMGSGKTVGIPQHETVIYSQSDSGMIIETSDKAKEKDLSGKTIQSFLLDGSLPELLDQHVQKINEYGLELTVFNSDDVLDEIVQINFQRAVELEKSGYIRFTNPARSIYKYTFTGGWALFIRGFFSQMKEAADQEKEKQKSKKR